MTSALDDIAAERDRRIADGGKDDTGLAKGIDLAKNYRLPDDYPNDIPFAFPWEPTFWKAADRRTNLVKAAALLVAEIERLDSAKGG